MIILRNLNGEIYPGINLIYLDVKTPSGNNEAELRAVLPCGRERVLCGFEKLKDAEKVLDDIYKEMLPAGTKNPNHIFVDLKDLQNRVAADGTLQA